MKVPFAYKLDIEMFKRLPVLTVLAILLMAAGVLVACGGSASDDDVVSTQPPSEDRPTPTAQPTIKAPESTKASSSSQEKLFLSADQFDEVEVELTAGDLLRVVYTSEVSISPGLGGTGHQERGVQLVVVDPNEEQLITAEELAENSIEVVAEVSGLHEIVFINPNKLEGLNVNLEYFINP